MTCNLLKFLKEQLISTEADDILVGQCVRFLYQNIRVLLATVTTITCLTLYVFWNTVDLVVLVLWGMLSFFLLFTRAMMLFVYSHLNPPDSEARRWAGYFTLSALAAGLIWASTMPLFFAPGSLLQKIYIAMMVVGMASGAMSMTAYWPPAYHNFMLPPMITLNVYMFAQGSTEWVGLAILELAFLVGILRVGKNQFSNFAHTVRLQSENIELINKLREQKARAEQANQSKTQFLASASHDLRQPVHSLALFADALNPEVTTARGRTLINNLTRSVESIDELLSSLLDISKLDAGVVKVNAADIPLQPILQKIHNEFFNTATNRGLSFRVHGCDLAVKSDPVLLTNIIRNLVSNALRYTRHGGVLVGCRARHSGDGEYVAIEVWDTGRGIPEAEREKIFAEFYQLDNPERDRGKGLGLGLAICQRLCGLLKHDLELNSRPGRGSVFRVYAPRARSNARFEIQPPEPDTVRPAQLEHPVVLVVDDEKEILTAMQSVLGTWNCRVLTAGSKQEALETIAGSPYGNPDLVICDYRLRGTETGSDVIAAIQSRLNRKTPAIIMTGDTDPERLREAESSGHVLLHKPVKPAELYRMIRDIVSERAA